MKTIGENRNLIIYFTIDGVSGLAAVTDSVVAFTDCKFVFFFRSKIWSICLHLVNACK